MNIMANAYIHNGKCKLEGQVSIPDEPSDGFGTDAFPLQKYALEQLPEVSFKPQPPQ